jgi:hypothetical protein
MSIRSFQIVLLLLPFSTLAQTTGEFPRANRNHILLEIGGAGGYGSVNYECLFTGDSKSKLLGRVGFFSYKSGYRNAPNIEHDTRFYTAPIGLTYLYGNKGHLELALNYTTIIERYIDEDVTHWGYLIVPSAGYRFENFAKNSVYFNLGFSPWLLKRSSDWEFQAFFKAGVGFAF